MRCVVVGVDYSMDSNANVSGQPNEYIMRNLKWVMSVRLQNLMPPEGRLISPIEPGGEYDPFAQEGGGNERREDNDD